MVRHAWFGLSAARWGESVLLGVSALCLVLSAGALGGVALGRVDLWIAAVLGGLLCASSWKLEHRVAPHEVARRIDRKLRHQGALVTAYELELREEAQAPLARLLLGRVLSRLRRRDALRAVLPPLALPVAAPLLAATALAVALQLTRSEPEVPSLTGVARGLIEGLEGVQVAAIESEGTPLETARQAQAALAQARQLARDLEQLREEDPEAALRRVEELDRKLAALGDEAARTPELGRSLTESRSWLDAVRQVLQREHAAAGTEPEAPDEPADGGGAGGEGAGGGGVTGGPEDGTMSGSTPLDATSGEGGGDGPSTGEGRPVPAARGAVESGSSAGAWWPAEYDDVVRRWLERTRDAADE
ncbi:MAG: hypothetical protein AAF682_08735 [Planctomycetota bacterium]